MSFSNKVTTMINIIKNTRNTLISKGETLEYDNDLEQKVNELTTLLKKDIERPENFTELVIPKMITEIGESAFEICRWLTSVTFHSGVTQVGVNSFKSCHNLTSIIFPQTVDSTMQIHDYAFGECEGLTEITLPNYLHSVGWNAFSSCRNLETVNIQADSFDAPRGSFSGCSKLENFSFNKILYIGDSAFSYCGFIRVDLSNSQCLTIGKNSFRENENLESVSLPNTLLTIGELTFYDNHKLKTINLPNSLTRFGDEVFLQCTALENVTVETGFNCNNLNLSFSTLYSVETIVSWFNALYDRTGDTAYTLTIGSTNLAKLSAEQIAIATNKNWNLA